MSEDAVKSLAQAATRMLPQEQLEAVQTKSNSLVYRCSERKRHYKSAGFHLVPQDVELLGKQRTRGVN